MELSAESVGGLQLVGNSARIPDKCFTRLLEAVLHNVADEDDHRSLSHIVKDDDVDTAVLKQAYASLATFVLEAAKHDAGPATLSAILEDSKVSPERAADIIKAFQNRKADIQLHLGSIGHSWPHIVDVDWRLDYCVKSSVIDKVNQPTYLITLKTEKSESRTTDDVQFSCTVEQLQDFVGKLKEAVKCVEKNSQQ